ncbi:MAG TPA: hypothetical protein VM115_01250 [Vicinamibacterales bacterium]|nr:hypothetical protein [Vicinamibacterales bacterium]
MPSKGRHVPALVFFAALSILWTWPLVRHFNDHIPGLGGDNYSFLWNLWWMRKALSAPELEFFHSTYLFSPFGVDLINHPHTALQGLISATALRGMSIVAAENLYIIVSVFLNAACAYALAFDLVRKRSVAIIAGVAFGGSPYVAAHLLGHFDLLTAWVIPLFALALRRSLRTGSVTAAIGAGLCVAIAAYAAYYHVVYLAVFAATYTLASWRVVPLHRGPRANTQTMFTVRLLLTALIALDAFLIVVILMFGGDVMTLGSVTISARSVHNPLLFLWLLAIAWLLTKWRVAPRFERPPSEPFWRGTQALMITVATFALISLPLIVQAFRLALSGRYVSQTYFWRSAPRGVDALTPLAGNPFHPLYGRVVTSLYGQLGLDRIEAVGWIGIVPLVVLLMHRGQWFDSDEARRWKAVLVVFAVWALGPFLTVAGFDAALPLPQALARFVPLVENARMPGRAMVGVYLALGVLMALRLAASAGLKASTTTDTTDTTHATHVVPTFRSASTRPAILWAVVALLALDYLHAPIPLTALDRPAVYEQLASIADDGAVIELPFGIGDGLSTGRGSQDRRLLYHATIHGHPVVGGYIGRMPPDVAIIYDAMPVVGNFLRLSNGEDAVQETAPASLPFRYLVLDTAAASQELVDYMHRTLDMDVIASSGGKQLYAVQGPRSGPVIASR